MCRSTGYYYHPGKGGYYSANPYISGLGPHVLIVCTDLTVPCRAGAFAKHAPQAYGQRSRPQIPTSAMTCLHYIHSTAELLTYTQPQLPLHFILHRPASLRQRRWGAGHRMAKGTHITYIP